MQDLQPPKLMLIGDMHIGRNPMRLPPRWDPAHDLGPSAAWGRAVDLAIEERVEALVMAGDVVDCLDDRFEAQRVLEAGLDRLRSTGIPAYAVVGNHDVKALPRLADLGLGLQLIGRGGRWQRISLHRGGQEFASLLGWSFDRPKQTTSPLVDLQQQHIDGVVPTLGVLHCDLGQNQSPYAPVLSAEFEQGYAARVEAWFLGHIHAPDHAGLKKSRPKGYLGSLVGLDCGETGPHGPWLVTVSGQTISAEQRPLGPIRFDHVDIDLSSFQVTHRHDIEDGIQQAFRQTAERHHQDQRPTLTGTECCALGLTLKGQVPQAAQFRAAAERLWHQGDLATVVGDCLYYASSVSADLRLPIDLSELATGCGPLASMAKIVGDLDGARQSEILPSLRAIYDRMAKDPRWRDLDHEEALLPGFEELAKRCALSVFNDMHDELANFDGETDK